MVDTQHARTAPIQELRDMLRMHARDSVRPPKTSKGGSLKRKFKKTRKHRTLKK
jgi:hypothetical protein